MLVTFCLKTLFCPGNYLKSGWRWNWERWEWGFPGGSVVKNLPAMQETWVLSLGWEDPLENGMATHSQYSGLENPLDRDLVGYSPHGCRESDIIEWLTLTQQWEYSILKDHRKEFSLFAGGRWWWSFQCHLTRSQWFSTLDPGRVRNKELLSSILGLIANRAHTVCSHWGQCVDILVSVRWWPVQVVSAAWLVYLYGGKY